MQILRLTRVEPPTGAPFTRIKARLEARDGLTASISRGGERRDSPLTRVPHRVPAAVADLRAPAARNSESFELSIRFVHGAHYNTKNHYGAAPGPMPVTAERMRSSCGGH